MIVFFFFFSSRHSRCLAVRNSISTHDQVFPSSSSSSVTEPTNTKKDIKILPLLLLLRFHKSSSLSFSWQLLLLLIPLLCSATEATVTHYTACPPFNTTPLFHWRDGVHSPAGRPLQTRGDCEPQKKELEEEPEPVEVIHIFIYIIRSWLLHLGFVPPTSRSSTTTTIAP